MSVRVAIGAWHGTLGLDGDGEEDAMALEQGIDLERAVRVRTHFHYAPVIIVDQRGHDAVSIEQGTNLRMESGVHL